MKKFGIALALGLGVVPAPSYAVTITLGAVNTPPPGGFSSGTSTIDFNSDTVNAPAPGFVGGLVRNGTMENQYAAPYPEDTTNYYSVEATPTSTSPATLIVSNIAQFSLYWGSIDGYNTLTFLGLNGGAGLTYNGAGSNENGSTVTDDFRGGAGDAKTNRLVTFTFTPDEASAITGIKFASTQNSFEFDNLSLISAVPEPSVWAMMMMGFGLVGAALRRRASAVAGALSIA